MRPPMQRGGPPPFYELDPYTFQRLCNDVLGEEPDVLSSHEYGTLGQSQYGIDLLAPRHLGLTYDVAQCKCYQAFSPADIRAVSDDFFAHWDYWSQYQIHRFILCVACDMSNRQRREAIVEERKRFGAHNIQYEVWDATTLRNKLAPHRMIVERHLDPWYVPIICGTEWRPEITGPGTSAVPLFPVSSSAGADSIVLSQALNDVAASVTREVHEQLRIMREAYREGRKQEAAHWVRNVQTDQARWLILQVDVKARILRFAAAIAFDYYGDLAQAQNLLADAYSLDPGGDDRRIRAVIMARQEGLVPAITLLKDAQDTDTANLRVALLLEHGDVPAARQVVETLQQQHQADAETIRLLALIHLAEGEVNQAQLAIQKARTIAPTWPAIQYTAATIDYYTTLTPGSVTSYLVAWPEPMDWAFIQRDDASLTRLRSAADVFHALATARDPVTDRANLFTWQLACLANDPERQHEAVACCMAMLQTAPDDYRAVIWAIDRQFPIDLKQSERVLNARIAGKEADIPHVQALARCYLTTGRTKHARKLLERTKDQFIAAGAGQVWDTWYDHAILLQGKRAEVAALLTPTSTSPAARAAQLATLRQHATETGDWAAVIAEYDRRYAETGHPGWLGECCEILANNKQWHALADRSDMLLRVLPTAAAVQLAALGLYHAQDYAGCLAVLDRDHVRFPHGRLPLDLRRMRVLCQRQIGIIPTAVSEAEALVREDPSPAHMLLLIQAYIDAADVRAIALTARELLRRPDIPPEQVLRVASLVALTDTTLAKALWRRILAVAAVVPEDVVSSALDLGYQLGCDAEMQPLLLRMSELGQSGQTGIQILSIAEAREMILQRQQALDDIATTYRTGAAPLHIIAALNHWPLATLYHSQLNHNAQDPQPLRQFTLLIRHGGRPSTSTLESTTPLRLHLDTTAVLLAAHLGLLDLLHQTYSALHLPADLTHALITMETMVARQQQSTVTAAQQVINLVDQGTIHVLEGSVSASDLLVPLLGVAWNDLYTQTRCLQGYLIDDFPLRSHDDWETTITLPSEAAPFVAPPHALIESLWRSGHLTEASYRQATRVLGVDAMDHSNDPVLPPPGTAVILSSTIPTALAHAEILDSVARSFDIWIEGSELERMRTLLRSEDERQAMQTWLSELRERIRYGIEHAHYHLVPFPHDRLQQDVPDRELTSEERVLFTLLLFPAKPNDVIWVDDRCVTGYQHQDGIPIIGIAEILQHLHSQGVLTDEEYYDKLLMLRAANVRFLPITAEELIHHLERAPIQDQNVIEMPSLRIVRRYVAACLRQDSVIQRSSITDHGAIHLGELPFVSSCRQAVLEAVCLAWYSSPDPNVSQVRAEWMYEHLSISHLTLLALTRAAQPLAEPRILLSMDLVEILIMGVLCEHQHQPAGSNASPYVQWILSRIILPRCEIDPHLPATIANRLKHALQPWIEDQSAETRSLIVLVMRLVYQHLPSSIQEELEQDAAWMAQLGYQQLLTVAVGEYTFDRVAFIAAATEAVNGRSMALIPRTGTPVFTVRRCQHASESGVVCLDDPESKVVTVIPDPELALLHESASERETFLRQNSHWFDRPNTIVEELIAHIATLDGAEERLQAATAWRARSLDAQYADLQTAIRRRQEVPIEVILPADLDEILWHLRLDPLTIDQLPLKEALETAAQTLMADLGLERALERLMSIPVPLPRVVYASFTALPPVELRAQIKGILRSNPSPLTLVHLLRLMLAVPSAKIIRLARRLCWRLLHGINTGHIMEYLTVVQWLDQSLGLRGEVRQWTVVRRLTSVWSAGDQIYRSIMRAGAQPGALASWFQDDLAVISPELFDRQPAYHLDDARPGHVQALTLILDGLVYATDHAQKDVFTPDLQAGFARMAFPEVNGQPFPHVHLINIPLTKASDFPSFLGGDRSYALQTLLAQDAATIVSRDSLTKSIEIACSRIMENSADIDAWSLIFGILGNRPADPETTSRVSTAIHGTDFGTLLAHDLENGLLTLQIAAHQVAHVSADTRHYLRDTLIRVAASLNSAQSAQRLARVPGRHADDAQFDVRAILLQVAQTLALGQAISSQAVEQFATMVTDMLALCPQMAAWCEPIIQRLWESLPIEQAQALWPLVLYLRAV